MPKNNKMTFTNNLYGEKITVFDLDTDYNDMGKDISIKWRITPVTRAYGIEKFDVEIVLIDGNIGNHLIYNEQNNAEWKVEYNQPKYLKGVYIKSMTILMSKKQINIYF